MNLKRKDILRETLQQRLAVALPGNVNANQITGVLAVVIPVGAALALLCWPKMRYTVPVAVIGVAIDTWGLLLLSPLDTCTP